MTSRQGLGVGGGTVSLRKSHRIHYCTLNMQGSFTDNKEFLQPYGFDVGQSERGNVLKGLDLGVEGMRVGGQVRF